MKKLSPNLMVKDVKETVDFYQQILGFSLVMAVPDTQDGIVTEITGDKKLSYALIKNGNVEIMLQEESSLREDISAFSDMKIGGTFSLYIEVDDLHNFYNGVKDNVSIIKDYATAWYGMDEFYIRDINGYVIGFAQKKG